MRTNRHLAKTDFTIPSDKIQVAMDISDRTSVLSAENREPTDQIGVGFGIKMM